MTSASSSSSSVSSTERKNEKYINPSTGQVETKHTESKPKQVVDNLVSKVKSTFSKEKTDEHNHQAGGASHIPPGSNANDPMMHHHGQQNKGMAGAAGGVAGAVAGAYKGAADRQHVGGVRPDQQTGHAAERNVHGSDVPAHSKERHGGMASNAAAKAGAAAGAVEGAASRGAEKITGRPRDTHGEQNVGMTANPFGDNKPVNDPMHQKTNNPMGQKTNDPMHQKTDNLMGQRQGGISQQMNDPMGQQMSGHMGQQTNNPMGQKLDPLGNSYDNTKQQHTSMGNVALDSRAGGQF
ncbi:hypothetical protein GGI15_000026 [Coemansia interrupta]|uniref:Uncharacterized protein n=1 Tax=Coemansia interrupta TaxID=1126814 RepID=A0A9W8HKY4_9FUNG|nr:hypothetical protein GGI15_000026 [Coemansia interrupta]